MKHILLLLLLAGCTTPMSIPVLEGGSVVAVPQPSPIKTSAVRWKIVDSAALQQMAADLKTKPDQEFVLYTLDTVNFTALTLNLNELRRYIEQEQASLKFAIGVINQSNATTTPQK